MSKKILSLMFCFVVCALTRADTTYLKITDAIEQTNSLELRAGHYFPSSKTINHVYNESKPDYSLQISHQTESRWLVWTNASHLKMKGSSRGDLHAKTKLNLRSLTAGANYLFPTNSQLTLYLGAGVGASNIHIDNEDIYYRSHYKKTNPCAVIKSGLKWDITDKVFGDLFLDYFVQRFSFKTVDNEVKGNPVNMSGFKFGIGIGFKF